MKFYPIAIQAHVLSAIWLFALGHTIAGFVTLGWITVGVVLHETGEL